MNRNIFSFLLALVLTTLNFNEGGPVHLARNSTPDKPHKSCIKGSRIRLKFQRKFVTFSPEIHKKIIDKKLLNKDKAFWKAITEGDFSLARSITIQGYKVLGSSYSCDKFQNILQTDTDNSRLNIKKKIDFLAMHQPHLFTSSFECEKSVFTGIHQNTANYITKMYPFLVAAYERIFDESLKNPLLNLDDKFYININPHAAWRRIDLAFASGRDDLIKKCCLLPKRVNCLNQNGQTIFTEAVLNHDLERIKLLNMRLSAGESMILKNIDDNDAIDLVTIDENDPEALVFCSLLSVLDSALKSGNVKLLAHLFSKFSNKARRLNGAALRAVKGKCLDILLGTDLKIYVPESKLQKFKTFLIEIVTKQ